MLLEKLLELLSELFPIDEKQVFKLLITLLL